jgi:exonuclease, DNA polymerase III, epsilon subunit family
MVNTFVAFDIETTGLRPGLDKIIEIGAVKVIDGGIKETFSRLINPQMALSEKIIQLTGITDNMLADAEDEKVVMSDFYDFLGNNIVLGHNVLFDYSFIKTFFYSNGINFEAQGIDTLYLSRMLHQELESRSLGNMCKHYKINLENAHRAYHDATATCALYFRLAEEFGEASEEIFQAKPLYYKVTKMQAITNKQKNYLLDLLKYHKINKQYILGELSVDALTKSQASRMIDSIILNYGRIL